MASSYLSTEISVRKLHATALADEFCNVFSASISAIPEIAINVVVKADDTPVIHESLVSFKAPSAL